MSKSNMARYSTAVVVSIAVWLLSFSVYFVSPVKTPWDSLWSLHTAMSFLQGRDGELSEYIPSLKQLKFYKIEYCKGRPYNRFPHAVSVFAMPAVAAAALWNPNFNEDLKKTWATMRFEQRVSAFYGALAALVFFWVVFSQFRSTAIALATTLIFAFCTSMWSTATRALWQHGPLVLMLVTAMLLLIQARRRPHLVQYVGLPLAIAYTVRPTASIPVAVLSAYVLLYYRPWFLRYLLWAAVIAIPWVAYNLYTCDAILPIYFSTSRLGTQTFGEALLGTLFSPSRGLFVYSSVLIFAFSGIFIAMQRREERPLYIAFCLIMVAHWIVTSQFWDWWGGHSLGPRYMTDIVPYLTFFLAFNFTLVPATHPWLANSVRVGIAVLAAVSFTIHGWISINRGAVLWNVSPADVNNSRARLWSWADPQFLRRVSTTWPHLPAQSTPPAPFATPIIFNNEGQGRPLLGEGWSSPESWGVWSEGERASLRLRLKRPLQALELRLFASGFEPDANNKQRVKVMFENREVAQLDLDSTPQWFSIELPTSDFADHERVYGLHFLIENPTSPARRSLSDDDRELGIALRQLIIEE